MEFGQLLTKRKASRNQDATMLKYLKSKVWFDSTTLHSLQGFSPVGISRVEWSVLRAALKLESEQMRFCTFDRYWNAMKPVDRTSIVTLLQEYGSVTYQEPSHAKRPKRGLSKFGNHMEKTIRLATRSSLEKIRRGVAREKNDSMQPGDTLVTVGNTWDYFDARMLKEMIVDRGLELVVVLHDIIPILFPHWCASEAEQKSFEEFAVFVANHASLILCDSQVTRRDFLEFADSRRIPPPNCEVLVLGTNPVRQPESFPANLPRALELEDFVLSVGSIQIRKNRQLLYQIWRRLAESKRPHIPKLVIAGGHGWLSKDLVHQIQTDPLTRDSIFFLKHLEDHQLDWLYANCRYTLYPSLYEGWGLPIVESLAHGKPCIASNTSSMPEAGQGLALHLDPYDFPAWYQAVVRWNEDARLIEQESERIRTHYVPRSWDDFGAQFLSKVQRRRLDCA